MLSSFKKRELIFLIFSWNFHRLVGQCISWFKESKHTHRSSFVNITNAVPSLQCIYWFKESKHTHRSSLANITNVVPSLQCISWFKESKHTHRSSLANITNAVPSLQCISWFKESKHTHRSSFSNITNVVPSLQYISWCILMAVLPILTNHIFDEVKLAVAPCGRTPEKNCWGWEGDTFEKVTPLRRWHLWEGDTFEKVTPLRRWHLLNLNLSSFQDYHMVLPQASPHHLKTPWKATEII